MSLFRRLSAAPLLLAAVMALAACARGPQAPPINLTDDGGAPWTLSSQRGKAVIVYFGFTHCADTCPATLARLARLAGRSGTRDKVEIAFVTVDPQRDSPEALHRFVTRFESGPVRIVGLTGSPAQIDAVESAYHVWAQRVPGSHRHASYDVAHSDAVYFVDAAGRTSSIHDGGDSDAVLAAALHEALTRWS
jgi:protein SCO1/2